MKTSFYAAKDITVDGTVLVKQGEVALVTETKLPIERALRGVENGALTTEKPKAAAEAAADAKASK